MNTSLFSWFYYEILENKLSTFFIPHQFEIFAADEHNAFYLLTPRMLEQIVRFADYANCQIALTFVGMSLYVAVDRPHSMFNASVRQSLTKQRQLIFDDAVLLKKAGEILIFGADSLTGSSYE